MQRRGKSCRRIIARDDHEKREKATRPQRFGPMAHALLGHSRAGPAPAYARGERKGEPAMLNWLQAITLNTRKAAARGRGHARERVRGEVAASARARIEQPRRREEPRLVPVTVLHADMLLRRCIAESARGASFYEIYDDLLRPSALVGNGVATLSGERGVVRKVPLRNGGAVVFNESTKRWELERYWSLRC
jgi:hypothetical protein